MAAVIAWRFDYAAVPHDMGTIGHSAERVLQGELPHADFDDPYTGLLSVLNAAAFHLFGISTLSARLPLAFFTVLSFVALYAGCRRVMDPWGATATTGAGFLASVPNYFSPMPTWYNLFCMIAVIVALLHFAATEHRRWMAVAGALAGLSFLFKSVGLYSVAVAALFAVFHEQRRSENKPPSATTTVYAWITIVGLGAYLLCVFVLLSAHPKIPELVTFAAPSLVLVLFLCGNEYRLRHQGSRERFARLLTHGAVFTGSFALVVGLFLIPYLSTGKISAWCHGVFVRPLLRLSDEAMGRPLDGEPFVLAAFFTAMIVLAVAIARKEQQTGRAVVIVAVLSGLSIILGCDHPSVYAAVWSTGRLLPLAVSLGLCWELRRRRQVVAKKRNSPATPAINDESAFLLVAAASVFGLVQVPLAHGIYFLYAAPLVIAAAAAVISTHFPQRRIPVGILAGGISLFVVSWVLPGHYSMFGNRYVRGEEEERIAGTRCPTICDPLMAMQYSEMIQEVERLTTANSTILAFPDSPDVYFMTARHNPTRTMFDAFDADYGTPERDRRLLETIERNRVDVVVVRNIVEFSYESLSMPLAEELRRRFPHIKNISAGAFPRFTVLWRDRRVAAKPGMPTLAGK